LETAKWHKIRLQKALENHKIIAITIADKTLCLVLKDNTVYAFAEICPHAGASLCEGWMDAKGQIVCPLHKYRYDPKNGRNVSGEGYKLKTFPVKEDDGGLWVFF
jgi:3-phenylpropionate/trans-cinnamate dioxygenase ferredoxin subunit